MVTFFLENHYLIRAGLLAEGLCVAAASIFLDIFSRANLPLFVLCIALLIILPSLIYRAIILASLAAFDLVLTRKPEKVILATSNVAAVRARITRLLMDKKLPFASLSASPLFVFGVERRVLNFFESRLGRVMPYVFFCKEPLVVLRLWPVGSSVMSAQRSTVAIVAEKDIRAKTLAQTIDTTIKYSTVA